jgi:hypothetical protein
MSCLLRGGNPFYTIFYRKDDSEKQSECMYALAGGFCEFLKRACASQSALTGPMMPVGTAHLRNAS